MKLNNVSNSCLGCISNPDDKTFFFFSSTPLTASRVASSPCSRIFKTLKKRSFKSAAVHSFQALGPVAMESATVKRYSIFRCLTSFIFLAQKMAVSSSYRSLRVAVLNSIRCSSTKKETVSTSLSVNPLLGNALRTIFAPALEWLSPGAPLPISCNRVAHNNSLRLLSSL